MQAAVIAGVFIPQMTVDSSAARGGELRETLLRFRHADELCEPSDVGRELREQGVEHHRREHRHLVFAGEFGKASCRDRVGQYVEISVAAVSLKKKIYNTSTQQQHLTTHHSTNE